MKETFKLTKFFISSFYRVPKQQILKAVIFIAFLYFLLQISVIHVAIYFIADTQLFMLYNIIIACVITFALTCYLSTTQFFSFREFTVLAYYPISFKTISTAKLLSSMFVPLLLLGIIEIPIFMLLIIDRKVIEIVKLLISLPIMSSFIVLLLLFALSLVNRVYYKFKNKTIYFITNYIVIFLFPLAFTAMYLKYKQTNNIIGIVEKVDLESINGWVKLIHSVLNQLYVNVMEIPILSDVVYSFTSHKLSSPFIIYAVSLTVLSVLFYSIIIHLTAISYYKNGLFESTQSNEKGSKVHISNNKWLNYLQREMWIIHSEVYFKIQVILGLLLAPVISFILLIFIDYDIVQIPLPITADDTFDKYYSYIVLFFSCINNVSGTPYSREGKYIHLLKSYPFHPMYVYFSKVIVASTMSLIAVLLSFLLLAIFGYWQTGTFMMLLIVAGLVICYNLLAPLYDKSKPLTDWSHPSEAAKSNPNVIISLLYGMPLLIFIAAIHLTLVWLNMYSLFVSFLILIVILGTLFVLITKLRTLERTTIATNEK